MRRKTLAHFIGGAPALLGVAIDIELHVRIVGYDG
jgi:hypothetical protein